MVNLGEYYLFHSIGNIEREIIDPYHEDIYRESLNVSFSKFNIFLKKFYIPVYKKFKDCLITFDDGYENNIEACILAAKVAGKRPIIFVSTGFIGKEFKYCSMKILSKKQLRFVSEYADIGSHGITHSALTLMTSKAAKSEIFDSKKKLEDILGKEVADFSYPYGYFNDKIKDTVMDAAYKRAFGTWIGQYLDTDDFSLSRIGICEGDIE